MPVTFETVAPHSSGIDSVIQLMRRLYDHDAIAFDESAARPALRRLLDNAQHGAVWLMRDEEHVVGYCVVTFGYSLEFHGIDAFLDELYICESHRGQGLARRVIELAEQTCSERGVRALHLEVERDNTHAQAVYRSLGFADHDRYLLTKWISR